MCIEAYNKCRYRRHNCCVIFSLHNVTPVLQKLRENKRSLFCAKGLPHFSFLPLRPEPDQGCIHTPMDSLGHRVSLIQSAPLRFVPLRFAFCRFALVRFTNPRWHPLQLTPGAAGSEQAVFAVAAVSESTNAVASMLVRLGPLVNIIEAVALTVYSSPT